VAYTDPEKLTKSNQLFLRKHAIGRPESRTKNSVVSEIAHRTAHNALDNHHLDKSTLPCS